MPSINIPKMSVGKSEIIIGERGFFIGKHEYTNNKKPGDKPGYIVEKPIFIINVPGSPAFYCF